MMTRRRKQVVWTLKKDKNSMAKFGININHGCRIFYPVQYQWYKIGKQWDIK